MHLTKTPVLRTVTDMEKQPYTTPELIELGDVISITRDDQSTPTSADGTWTLTPGGSLPNGGNIFTDNIAND